jgi:hypothetical protein
MEIKGLLDRMDKMHRMEEVSTGFHKPLATSLCLQNSVRHPVDPVHLVKTGIRARPVRVKSREAAYRVRRDYGRGRPLNENMPSNAGKYRFVPPNTGKYRDKNCLCAPPSPRLWRGKPAVVGLWRDKSAVARLWRDKLARQARLYWARTGFGRGVVVGQAWSNHNEDALLSFFAWFDYFAVNILLSGFVGPSLPASRGQPAFAALRRGKSKLVKPLFM